MVKIGLLFLPESQKTLDLGRWLLELGEGGTQEGHKLMESRPLKGTDRALGPLGWSGCGAVDLRFLSYLNPGVLSSILKSRCMEHLWLYKECIAPSSPSLERPQNNQVTASYTHHLLESGQTSVVHPDPECCEHRSSHPFKALGLSLPRVLSSERLCGDVGEARASKGRAQNLAVGQQASFCMLT